MSGRQSRLRLHPRISRRRWCFPQSSIYAPEIPGASGIYPIQLMPEFFQSLYPWFPFTYGIDAMREVISGFAGDAYWRYLGMLLVFVALAFFLGLVLHVVDRLLPA